VPFVGGGGVGVAALVLGNVGFPFGLAGELGETGHVAFPVEIIHGVADHKDLVAETVDLHVEDAYLALAGHDFGPYMGVDFDIFTDEFIVGD